MKKGRISKSTKKIEIRNPNYRLKFKRLNKKGQFFWWGFHSTKKGLPNTMKYSKD